MSRNRGDKLRNKTSMETINKRKQAVSQHKGITTSEALGAKIQEWETTWISRCYSAGVPDECPNEIRHIVPNWKSIAISIISNDMYLGGIVRRPHSEHYDAIKRAELIKRGCAIQLKLPI